MKHLAHKIFLWLFGMELAFRCMDHINKKGRLAKLRQPLLMFFNYGYYHFITYLYLIVNFYLC